MQEIIEDMSIVLNLYRNDNCFIDPLTLRQSEYVAGVERITIETVGKVYQMKKEDCLYIGKE